MIHVYLDDYRSCPQGFVLARDAEACKLLIDDEQQPIDVLSLDYDLGWGQPTGLEVVKHLVMKGRYPRRIYFHTSSSVGRMAMYGLLMDNAPKDVQLYNGPMPALLVEQIGSQ